MLHLEVLFTFLMGALCSTKGSLLFPRTARGVEAHLKVKSGFQKPLEMEKGPNALRFYNSRNGKKPLYVTGTLLENIKWPLVALGAFQYFPVGPWGPFSINHEGPKSFFYHEGLVAYRVLSTFSKGALGVFFYIPCEPCCIQGPFNFPNGTHGSFPHVSPCYT